jgi:hypothetical protein
MYLVVPHFSNMEKEPWLSAVVNKHGKICGKI